MTEIGPAEAGPAGTGSAGAGAGSAGAGPAGGGLTVSGPAGGGPAGGGLTVSGPAGGGPAGGGLTVSGPAGGGPAGGGLTVIRAGTVLPARREDIVLHTVDGLDLVGELALPRDRPPAATLICLHPLPIAGGMMDSHVLRKASFRLPALADLAVLRFNTRGTSSERGTSEGEFGAGETERHDLTAAIAYCVAAGFPRLWLLAWSFGTALALKWGNVAEVEGAILLSPPLRVAVDADLDRWAASGRPLVALAPELDDYLRPTRPGSGSPGFRRHR